MSPPTLTYKYVGSATISAATFAACADALYSLGIAATYADATSRTEGAGKAWTWTDRRYQSSGVTESLYPSPPSGYTGIGMSVLFSGSAAAKTPTMASGWSDTWATAMVLLGVVREPGAYNAWDNANPMTSGTFSGYWRCVGASSPTKVHLWESAEVLVVAWETASNTAHLAIAGAPFSPESDHALDAESDGRGYGMIVSGSGAACSTTFWSMASNNNFFDNESNLGYNHCAMLAPGGSTMTACQAAMTPTAAMTATGLKTRAGRYAHAPILMRATAAAPNDYYIGVLRGIDYFTDGHLPTALSSGGTTVGYVISGSSVSATDAFMLRA